MSLEDLEDLAIKCLYVRYDLKNKSQQQQQEQQQQQQEQQQEQQQQQQQQEGVFESFMALKCITKDGTPIVVPAETR